ncbi:uncharacterized protein DNG_05241 [Cephalotrichum gorgonifer]|uniref:Methyltransferase domain-containing protein n=1 Tax=Cephalotrichum gorgonifer TaxID=2041049 RepID=A0AAE8MZK0_9PEZI|nr:uncharacterized protein DNG_05241 [Cephalotrichum gorgonifer]
MAFPAGNTPRTTAEHFDHIATQYESTIGGATRDVAIQILQLPQVATLFSPHARVLDNACGTAIVSEEIARSCTARGVSPIPTISAVDLVPKIVDIARAKFAGTEHASRVQLGHMAGEELAFADGTFSHSITNLGIPFFRDPERGAREIYRTLGSGGVAVVTSWADLGYLDGVIRPAMRVVRPLAPAFNIPIAEAWDDPAHVERCLRGAGFQGVEVLGVGAHYGAASLEDLSRNLRTLFTGATRDYSEEEQVGFGAEVTRLAGLAGETYTRADGRPGLGIPMRAIVAVCQKY